MILRSCLPSQSWVYCRPARDETDPAGGAGDFYFWHAALSHYQPDLAHTGALYPRAWSRCALDRVDYPGCELFPYTAWSGVWYLQRHQRSWLCRAPALGGFLAH